MPAMPGSLAACMTALTEPMLRPHRAMVEVGCGLSARRKYSMTVSTSSRSYQPSEMYSPSLWPHAAKSRAKREAPVASTVEITCSASARHDALPCR